MGDGAARTATVPRRATVTLRRDGRSTVNGEGPAGADALAGLLLCRRPLDPFETTVGATTGVVAAWDGTLEAGCVAVGAIVLPVALVAVDVDAAPAGALVSTTCFERRCRFPPRIREP
jgi:hypothetical protein